MPDYFNIAGILIAIAYDGIHFISIKIDLDTVFLKKQSVTEHGQLIVEKKFNYFSLFVLIYVFYTFYWFFTDEYKGLSVAVFIIGGVFAIIESILKKYGYSSDRTEKIIWRLDSSISLFVLGVYLRIALGL